MVMSLIARQQFMRGRKKTETLSSCPSISRLNSRKSTHTFMVSLRIIAVNSPHPWTQGSHGWWASHCLWVLTWHQEIDPQCSRNGVPGWNYQIWHTVVCNFYLIVQNTRTVDTLRGRQIQLSAYLVLPRRSCPTIESVWGQSHWML